MTADINQQIKAFLDGLADQVSEWDWALVRQAVLATGYRLGEFSANDFRDLLPGDAQQQVGKVIRQLPSVKHGELVTKAKTVDGYPKTVPSTAFSTHGKHLQVWKLTPAGRDAARRLLGYTEAA